MWSIERWTTMINYKNKNRLSDDKRSIRIRITYLSLDDVFIYGHLKFDLSFHCSSSFDLCRVFRFHGMMIFVIQFDLMLYLSLALTPVVLCPRLDFGHSHIIANSRAQPNELNEYPWMGLVENSQQHMRISNGKHAIHLVYNIFEIELIPGICG